MENALRLNFEVNKDDFSNAGEASGKVKQTLKRLGFSPDVVRRTAIAMYEAEINMVIHANGGVITVEIRPDGITAEFCDNGPGIPDIDTAMREGWSTASEVVREMGFGAGMGLPNMKKYTDDLEIHSEPGVGTTVIMKILPS